MKSPRSFTLLEIMVAFLVMAVLSALAIPSLIGVINNDQKNADSVTAVNTADKVYYTAVQAGTSATPLPIGLPGCPANSSPHGPSSLRFY
jgi:type II secretory pathway pseudopilin PulG